MVEALHAGCVVLSSLEGFMFRENARQGMHTASWSSRSPSPFAADMPCCCPPFLDSSLMDWRALKVVPFSFLFSSIVGRCFDSAPSSLIGGFVLRS